MTPWGVANLDLRGLIGRIYVDHQTLLHTKSVSSGPHGFREEGFWKFFSYIVLHKHITPALSGVLQGLDLQDLKRDTLHIATY